MIVVLPIQGEKDTKMLIWEIEIEASSGTEIKDARKTMVS